MWPSHSTSHNSRLWKYDWTCSLPQSPSSWRYLYVSSLFSRHYKCLLCRIHRNVPRIEFGEQIEVLTGDHRQPFEAHAVTEDWEVIAFIIRLETQRMGKCACNECYDLLLRRGRICICQPNITSCCRDLLRLRGTTHHWRYWTCASAQHGWHCSYCASQGIQHDNKWLNFKIIGVFQHYLNTKIVGVKTKDTI